MAQRENIIAKVTKILARAKSINFEQEAQTALLLAQKLLAANKSIIKGGRNNVQRLSVGEPGNMPSLQVQR